MKIKMSVKLKRQADFFTEARKTEKYLKVLEVAAVEVETEAKKNIMAHEPPVFDTGALWNSIKVRSLNSWKYEVGNQPYTFYGAYHEFGKRGMAARPFLRPAAKVARKNLIRRMRIIATKFE